MGNGLALLMKISPASFDEAGTVVALAKSDKDIGDECIGDEIYVWFTDSVGQKSSLAGRARMLSVRELDAPQKQNPNKTTKALCIAVEQCDFVVSRPLTTDDVEAFRYDPPRSSMADIGRLHRDRNEKIIKISDSARDILGYRFE